MLDDRELIKEIILPNLPMSIKYQLKMQGESTLSWNRVKELLTNLFTLINLEQAKPRNGNKRDKRRGNYNNNNIGQNRRNGGGYNNNNSDNNNGRYNNNQEEAYQQRSARNTTTRTKTRITVKMTVEKRTI